jgi:ribonuclease G
MAKEMIVSVNGREKKIAIVENGRVTEFFIERGEENSGVAGNVYKGRVMRVLPGMQSAFVDIGLERDAFLYVTDFFDEEEEIERVVMEKNKKASPEEVKREADDRIGLARATREKQMEAAQEITEPLADAPAQLDIESGEPVEEPQEKKRGRRGRRGREAREEAQESDERISVGEPAIEIDFDASGFERIGDDESDVVTPRKAAAPEKVSVGKFDEDTIAEAEVGSLLDSVDATGNFERIADEDEEAEKPKKRGRAKAAAKDELTEAEGKKKKPAAKRGAAAKGKFAKPKAKKTKKTDELEGAEASEKQSADLAEMAVRRGGRGRRRGAKAQDEVKAEVEDFLTEPQEDSIDPATVEVADSEVPSIEAAEGTARTEANENGEERQRGGREGRGRRGGRGRSERTNGDRAGNERANGDRQGDERQRGDGRRDRGRYEQPKISDLLKEGQEILVQIAKEPIAKKGARITSHIALPGRYLVYMPTIEHLGVSRKIESSSERTRLRGLIQKIRQDKEITTGGFIVRTAGVGVAEEDLRNDAKYLARMWADSKKASEKKKAPSLVHQDLDLVQRLLRDQLADDFSAIRVDSEEEYQRTVEFMNLIQPRMVNRVKLYTRDKPILEYYGVQEEIDKALKPRVWLKSGGYLVINQTEALVAIDVNTGKFVGKGNARLEDTITRTNLEAVEEIARQIRLRDLGGILVLDLIDMEDRRNRNKVAEALREALSSDRSPTKVLSFNDFGLIIMTRKRVKQSLERTMCAPCDYCEGAGWVKSPTTMCYEILAEARRLSKSVEDVRHTTLRVHPDVAKAFRNGEREVLEEIEAYLGSIDLTTDKSMHQAQFDFAFV